MKILISAFALFVSFATVGHAAPIKISAGTLVIVSLTDTISSETHTTGDNVNAIVAADVVVDGQTLIRAGSRVTASIVHANDTGAIGKAGSLNIQITGVYAVDGTFVAVNGSKAAVGEDETTGTVVVGVILCPLALLNEGEKAEVGANTQIRAITISDVTINP